MRFESVEQFKKSILDATSDANLVNKVNWVKFFQSYGWTCMGWAKGATSNVLSLSLTADQTWYLISILGSTKRVTIENESLAIVLEALRHEIDEYLGN